MNPIERAADNADKINAANAELERQTREKFIVEHFAIIHVTDDVPAFDTETETLGLDDCLYWPNPDDPDCSGRVGTIIGDPNEPRIVLCERHYNTNPEA